MKNIILIATVILFGINCSNSNNRNDVTSEKVLETVDKVKAQNVAINEHAKQDLEVAEIRTSEVLNVSKSIDKVEEKPIITKNIEKPKPKNENKVISKKATKKVEEVEKETTNQEIKPSHEPSQKLESKDVIAEREQKEKVNETTSTAVEKVKPMAGVDHTSWDILLKKHVSAAGKVNYEGFKGDKAKLKEYTMQLSENHPSDSWAKKEQLAYWINAYNAFTVLLILDNYPVKSIKDIAGGKPWDKNWISIGSEVYSLNNIENNIIRPQFNEPRIHFAVNCAAKSCPPLLNEAWTVSNLEKNFDKQTKKFVKNSKYNKISGDNAEVSNIFNWYKADFGDLAEFLSKYAGVPIDPAKISYMDYDWSLNN